MTNLPNFAADFAASVQGTVPTSELVAAPIVSAAPSLNV